MAWSDSNILRQIYTCKVLKLKCTKQEHFPNFGMIQGNTVCKVHYLLTSIPNKINGCGIEWLFTITIISSQWVINNIIKGCKIMKRKGESEILTWDKYSCNINTCLAWTIPEVVFWISTMALHLSKAWVRVWRTLLRFRWTGDKERKTLHMYCGLRYIT